MTKRHMTMKFRPGLIVGLAIPALFAGYCTHRDNALESNFAKVSVGMSPDQVMGIMGKPSWDGRCGAKMPTGLPGDCVREFGYAVTIPLVPRYYLVWFGREGRVTESAPITSP